MANPASRIRVRPPKDEWGVYDPQQAGLAALYARLDSKDAKSPALPEIKAAAEKPEPLVARPSLRDAK